MGKEVPTVNDEHPPAAGARAPPHRPRSRGARRQSGRPADAPRPPLLIPELLRSRTGRMRRCGRRTGIGHRNEQQDRAHGLEELARRPESRQPNPISATTTLDHAGTARTTPTYTGSTTTTTDRASQGARPANITLPESRGPLKARLAATASTTTAANRIPCSISTAHHQTRSRSRPTFLAKNVALEAVQYLAGHSNPEPRSSTTRAGAGSAATPSSGSRPGITDGTAARRDRDACRVPPAPPAPLRSPARRGRAPIPSRAPPIASARRRPPDPSAARGSDPE